MSTVSYQSILPSPDAREPEDRFEPLPDGAIATRRRDAKRSITVRVSKAQRRWLSEVESISGKGIDEHAVLRALIDVGTELPIDWALLAGASSVRKAVRETIAVRSREGG